MENTRVKIEHLNLALSAIRNVNRLLIKERDPGRLLQAICDALIKKSRICALMEEIGGDIVYGLYRIRQEETAKQILNIIYSTIEVCGYNPFLKYLL